MAKILLDEMLEKREKSLYWLWQTTGIGHTILLRYQKNIAQRMTLTHIDLICTALDCESGDLIQAKRVKMPTKKKAATKKKK